MPAAQINCSSVLWKAEVRMDAMDQDIIAALPIAQRVPANALGEILGVANKHHHPQT